jgi:precorrin-6A/cobalt-precorrin-6A reductase
VKVLLLGGTSESRQLAAAVAGVPGIELITSLAGRVAEPAPVSGHTRIGGFGGADALAQWIRDNAVDALVDATHPFAATITAHADYAARTTGVAHLVLTRPPWIASTDDQWTTVASLPEAAASIEPGSRVFLTIGRQGVHHFAGVADAWFLIRSIDPPTGAVPPHTTLELGRGPFDLAHESAMLADNRIDLLVTKNSGGTMTRAKLDAARSASIPVLMISRPTVDISASTVDEVDAAARWLIERLRVTH